MHECVISIKFQIEFCPKLPARCVATDDDETRIGVFAGFVSGWKPYLISLAFMHICGLSLWLESEPPPTTASTKKHTQKINLYTWRLCWHFDANVCQQIYTITWHIGCHSHFPTLWQRQGIWIHSSLYLLPGTGWWRIRKTGCQQWTTIKLKDHFKGFSLCNFVNYYRCFGNSSLTATDSRGYPPREEGGGFVCKSFINNAENRDKSTATEFVNALIISSGSCILCFSPGFWW